MLKLKPLVAITSQQFANAKRRDYSFFEYNFSKKVWQSVLRLCSIHRAVGTWRQELAWTILKLKGKSLLVVILKLAWSAYLYVVWRQRNKKYFGASLLTEDTILVQIKEIVRVHLGGSLINRTNPTNASLYTFWGIIG
ncbi:hypothetical protein ES288_D08G078600v1 [Gossypium darwinii]|uniref:Reverse transcriptase zinc-binding domain-containing protein n=2 Tax=Gossypium TaxID=3633 RepID=A0A5D2BJZ7_GOSDA|nr:hypothetical protein ES288_D08G078600v1 [Gossypium darwinii]